MHTALTVPKLVENTESYRRMQDSFLMENKLDAFC